MSITGHMRASISLVTGVEAVGNSDFEDLCVDPPTLEAHRYLARSTGLTREKMREL
jgi:hypothetical protein